MQTRVRAVVVDFDGTVTAPDCTSWLLHRFLRPEVERLQSKARSGRVDAHEFYGRLVPLLPADLESLEEMVLERCRLTTGFDAFVRHCRRRGIALAVASDGLGFYIDAVLARHSIGGLEVFANRLRAENERLEMEFPHAHPRCTRCGTCKRLVVDRYRALGPVAFVGDGPWDIYAAARADLVLAKDGLLAECNEKGIEAVPWCDFYDVMDALESSLCEDRRVRDVCPSLEECSEVEVRRHG